ncbi:MULTISPECIES: ornithine cyclodeaminase family protein [unclassified Micromonospora]|uniref:ornithine cyclodeaminase family protein n=1 Tax=unclassified Micromonospora TaxID=2617518 RepID=UPI003320CC6D
MIPYLSADDVFALLPPADAVAAIEAALRAGLDPSTGVPRTTVPLRHGSMLLMPAESAAHAGVKLVTVAPANPARGLPRINALYAVFDATTLRPAAIIDGTALTTLRTPAVSFAAVRQFLPPAPHLVVFGAGPQSAGHVATLAALVTPASVTVVTRTGALPKPGLAAPAPARAPGNAVAADPLADAGARPLRAGTPEVDAAVQAADVVVCATTAREPLFDSALLGDRAVVVAVGSHEPDAREVDSAFCARATVIVEDRATALRESGDVVRAVADGALAPERLLTIGDVLHDAPTPGGPILFKGSGMSWQDLVIAEALLARVAGGT